MLYDKSVQFWSVFWRIFFLRAVVDFICLAIVTFRCILRCQVRTPRCKIHLRVTIPECIWHCGILKEFIKATWQCKIHRWVAIPWCMIHCWVTILQCIIHHWANILLNIHQRIFTKDQNCPKAPLVGPGEAIWCKKTNTQKSRDTVPLAFP